METRPEIVSWSPRCNEGARIQNSGTENTRQETNLSIARSSTSQEPHGKPSSRLLHLHFLTKLSAMWRLKKPVGHRGFDSGTQGESISAVCCSWSRTGISNIQRGCRCHNASTPHLLAAPVPRQECRRLSGRKPLRCGPDSGKQWTQRMESQQALGPESVRLALASLTAASCALRLRLRPTAALKLPHRILQRVPTPPAPLH